MEEENLALLFQLTRTLQDGFSGLRASFEAKDYEKYEKFKVYILDIQNKIGILLKKT